MPAKRGKFITFEGPEGSGKSTQALRLGKHVRAAGYRVCLTREPGGTPTGDAIRAILQYDKAGEPLVPESELLLFAASRAQLVRRVILPALAAGTWVICDRFFDSTTAYQGYGRGFDLATVATINSFAVGPAIPDLTLLIDVAVEAGFRRLRQRQRGSEHGHDRIEREARAFHRRMRAGYLVLARKYPGRIKIIDGRQSPRAVEAAVWKAVQDVLG
jgi:dTMP kinase